MINLNLNALKEYLAEKKMEATADTETRQLMMSFQFGGREFPLFIKILEGDELLQMLLFFPCTIVPATMSDTARLLHLINKEIDLPGFGMDEVAKLLFYRCLIPVKDKQIDQSMIDAYLNAIQIAFQTFTAVIVSVASGAISYDDVVKQSDKIKNKHK